MKKLNVIVVDDHATFRDGITFYLKEILEHNVIGQFSNGIEFSNTELVTQADIILMDIEMPKLNGFDAIKMVLWHYPMLKIIAITSYRHKTFLKELILAGFKGCVLKDEVNNELEKAMYMVAEGKLYFNSNIKLLPNTEHQSISHKDSK